MRDKARDWAIVRDILEQNAQERDGMEAMKGMKAIEGIEGMKAIKGTRNRPPRCNLSPRGV